jgi:hypothetical protein
MSILIITPFQILFAAMMTMALYISAIMVLLKTKSGILPYLVVILFPIVGPLGILFGNYAKKIK